MVAIVVIIAMGTPTLVGATDSNSNSASTAVEQEDIDEVTVDKLTIQTLQLRSVAIQNATFRNVTGSKVVTPTGVTFVTQKGNRTIFREQQNVTEATLTMDRVIDVTGTLTNVVLRNVTIRNESVAEAIFKNGTPEDTANVTLKNLTLRNRTIEELIINKTLVDSVSAKNVRLIDKGYYTSLERAAGKPAVVVGFASAQNATFSNVTVQVGLVRPNETEPSRSSGPILPTLS